MVRTAVFQRSGTKWGLGSRRSCFAAGPLNLGESYIRSEGMEPHIIEKYHSYRLYSIDLGSALHPLRVLKRYRREDVRYCLLRDIVVSYARPFSGNKGEKIPKHTLTKKVVQKELRPLHCELIDARNRLFAHTDFTYRRPKTVDLSTSGRKWFPMSLRSYDYGKLDRRVLEIEKLIASVTANLQSEIEHMEENF
jgi:hypothetical protein